jgi:hypothetical protein
VHLDTDIDSRGFVDLCGALCHDSPNDFAICPLKGFGRKDIGHELAEHFLGRETGFKR